MALVDAPQNPTNPGNLSRGRERSADRYAQGKRLLDALTEVLLYALVIGGPWLLGSTHTPVIWSMTAVGGLLGLVAIARHQLGRAARSRTQTGPPPGRGRVARGALRLLGLLTVLIPTYMLTAALNPRAEYEFGRFRLTQLSHIGWLPSTYDAGATWFLFWQYLGIAAAFWATRQWLLQDPGRRQDDSIRARDRERSQVRGLPPRLGRLVLVGSVSGALLGAEAMLQRTLGSELLLFFFEPNFPGVERIYGPYAYRSNAAQYLNLIWPVTAGAAWVHAQQAHPRTRRRSSIPWVLAGCSGIMAVASFTSLSRGGVMVAAAQLVALIGLLLLVGGGKRSAARLGYAALAVIALQVSLILGWHELAPRLSTALTDRLSGRLDIYANAEAIARDHPWFGTGPGSFPLMYRFYRPNEQTFWAPQAHNDWLETRITFGWIGMALIVAILPLLAVPWFAGDGLQVHWIMPATLGLALAGALIHARFDYPFQIHSILSCFALLAAALVSLSRSKLGSSDRRSKLGSSDRRSKGRRDERIPEDAAMMPESGAA